MPLRIALKAGEKVIINGAVLQATDPATVLVHNEAVLLREKDIMTEERATTPAARIYYAIQCAYLFPNSRDLYLRHFYAFLGDFISASPSSAALVETVKTEVEAERWYKALRSVRKLMGREQEILNAFGSRQLQPGSPTG